MVSTSTFASSGGFGSAEIVRVEAKTRYPTPFTSITQRSITCEVESFFAVRDVLEPKFGEPLSAKLDWRPENSVSLDEEKARTVLKLLDVLEDNDDVQNVYANFDLPEGVAEALSA